MWMPPCQGVLQGVVRWDAVRSCGRLARSTPVVTLEPHELPVSVAVEPIAAGFDSVELRYFLSSYQSDILFSSKGLQF